MAGADNYERQHDTNEIPVVAADAARDDLSASDMAPVEPMPDEQTEIAPLLTGEGATGPAQYKRREALRLFAGLTLLGLAGAPFAYDAGRYVINRASQGQQLINLRQRFLDTMRSLPSEQQLAAETFAPGGAILDLRQYDGDGPTVLRVGAAGMSTAYLYGTMDDGTGPLDQPHAAWQYARNALDAAALDRIGAAALMTCVVAVPGAPQAARFRNDPSGRAYGVNSDVQLGNPALHSFFLAGGSDENTISLLTCEGGGRNDIRDILTSAAQFSHDLSDIGRAIASNEHAARDIERRYEWLMHAIGTVATGYGGDLVASGDMMADIHYQLIAAGKHGLVAAFSVMPGLRVSRYVPIGLLDNQTNSPDLRQWVAQDTVDPNYPNRWCLDLHAIPYGPDLAYYYQVLMQRSQNSAQREIYARHPTMAMMSPIFIGVNERSGYYAVRLHADFTKLDGTVIPAGTLLVDGDGHPGDDGVLYDARRWLTMVVGGAPDDTPVSAASLAKLPFVHDQTA